MRHAVHGVVGLDLGGRQLGHVGHLVHLLGEGLLGEQHLGLLVGLCRLALFEQVLDLLLEDGVLLGRLLRLAPRLLGVEARLELDLHVARELAVRHCGCVCFVPVSLCMCVCVWSGGGGGCLFGIGGGVRGGLRKRARPAV